jgi:hypothetical protein
MNRTKPVTLAMVSVLGAGMLSAVGAAYAKDKQLQTNEAAIMANAKGPRQSLLRNRRPAARPSAPHRGPGRHTTTDFRSWRGAAQLGREPLRTIRDATGARHGSAFLRKI